MTHTLPDSADSTTPDPKLSPGEMASPVGTASSSGTAPVAEVPPKLLIVDDEPAILSAMKRVFRGEGYQVLTANSGKEALELLQQTPVDVVLSDMRMPEMDGAQFLEQVFSHWPATKRILLTGYSDASATVAAINRGKIWRYLAKPWNDDELRLTVKEALAHRKLLEENARLSALTQQQNIELKALNASLEDKVAERTVELQQANDNLHKSFVATVRLLSHVIELREGRLAGQSRRVADLARHLAEELDLDEVEQRNILLAGLLHNIGKIGLPDKLIGRAFNALSPAERLEVMQHPEKGAEFLKGVPQLGQAALIIRHQHEAMDGTGFPSHLAGLSIPLGARILAVARDYDALQNGALAMQAHSPKEAQEYLRQQRGKRYDPRVVDAFIGMLGQSGQAQPSTLRPTAPKPASPVPRWHQLDLSTAKLKDGMRLARDLRHHVHGYLLLAAGNYLDDAIIRQLREIELAERCTFVVSIRVDNKP